MSSRSDTTSPYVEAFEAARPNLPGGAGPAQLRRAAIERFASQGFPGRKSEEWRYADLKPLTRTAFQPAGRVEVAEDAALEPLAIAGLGGPVLVFVNGHFDPAQSRLSGLADGVTVTSFAEAAGAEDGELAGVAGELAEADALAQLNTAMMGDGYVIDLAPGTRLAAPIHVVSYMTRAEGRAAHLRNVIRLGAGASAEIVETFAGDESAYFVDSVTQAKIAGDARLKLHRRQREGDQAVHLSRSFVTLARGRFDMACLARGAISAHHEMELTFTEEGGAATFNGVQLARVDQTQDMRTFIDHGVAECTSDQTYRGVLAGGAKAAFQGKILVRRDAQKSDANQHSASLLLDRRSEADAKPELEIYADDVQCAHGSTVGELDANQLFYLTSRGLSPAEAKTLLVEAFVAERLGAIETEAVREAMTAEARAWMDATLQETDL